MSCRAMSGSNPMTWKEAILISISHVTHGIDGENRNRAFEIEMWIHDSHGTHMMKPLNHQQISTV